MNRRSPLVLLGYLLAAALLVVATERLSSPFDADELKEMERSMSDAAEEGLAGRDQVERALCVEEDADSEYRCVLVVNIARTVRDRDPEGAAEADAIMEEPEGESAQLRLRRQAGVPVPPRNPVRWGFSVAAEGPCFTARFDRALSQALRIARPTYGTWRICEDQPPVFEDRIVRDAPPPVTEDEEPMREPTDEGSGDVVEPDTTPIGPDGTPSTPADDPVSCGVVDVLGRPTEIVILQGDATCEEARGIASQWEGTGGTGPHAWECFGATGITEAPGEVTMSCGRGGTGSVQDRPTALEGRIPE